MGLIGQAGVLVLGGVLFAEAVALFYRFGSIGVGAALALFTWQAVSQSTPSANLGAVTVYAQDLLFLCLAAAGGVRLVRSSGRKLRGRAMVGMVLFGMLGIVSFARGGSVNGVEAAGNDFRAFFYFAAGVLYMSARAYSPQSLVRILRLWVVVGLVTLLVVSVRWGMVAAGVASESPWWSSSASPGGAYLRVIYAAPALVMAQVALITMTMPAALGGARWWRILPILLLPALVVLQHRSVWAVLLASMVVLAWLGKRIRGRLAFAVAGSLIVASAMLLVGSGTGLGSVAASVEGSALEAIGAQRSTLLWRVEGWRALLSDERLSEPLDFLIGLPFGSGYLRSVFGSQIGVSPHNFYISVFLRMGVLGLLAFALLYIGCLRPLMAAARQEGADAVPAQILFVLLTSQLLFFVPYGPSYEQGMLLGAALGLVSWLPETMKDQRSLPETSWVRLQLPQS